MTVHLVKICVGVDSIAHLAEIQAGRLAQARRRGEPAPRLRHWTRHAPTRRRDLLGGGSLYWVIKGLIQVRQQILDVERGINPQGRPSCALVLGPQLVRTELRPHRPFQGWRYLRSEDAPADAPPTTDRADEMPTELVAELRQLGLL